MKSTTSNYSSLDELVFEHRNISYGAYALRQKYEKNLITGLLVSIGIFALGMAGPEILKNFEGDVVAVTKTTTTICELVPPPSLIPPVAPPVVRMQPPPPPRTASLLPTVTDQEVPEVELFQNNAPAPPSPVVEGDGGPVEYVFTEETGTVEPEEKPFDEPFVFVEQMPSFKGNIGKYLSETIKYPQRAIDNNMEGKVFLSFVVGVDGEITDIIVLRGISKELDEEAVRVVSKMPAWNPGKQSGKAVPVKYSLPIHFQLSSF